MLIGEVLISAPTPFPTAPEKSDNPLKFEVPLVIGSIFGVGFGGALLTSVTAESNRLEQTCNKPAKEDKNLEVRSEELGVRSKELEVTELPTTNTHSPIPDNLEFYDWDDLEDEAVGVLIFGNSGSAKTSLACWLAGQLTKNKPAQVLALDPHANRNPLWGELGIKVFSSFELIERQLKLLEKTLDERRDDDYQPKDDDFLIIFGDELGANIDCFSDPSLMDKILRRLGGEGRKYDLMFIGLNYSSNADDINVSAKTITYRF